MVFLLLYCIILTRPITNFNNNIMEISRSININIIIAKEMKAQMMVQL